MSLKDYNDLKKEWSNRNECSIESVGITSRKKFWWQCEDGHEWMATTYDRIRGSGCPYCQGHLPIKGLTDLATVRPDLAEQWDLERNECGPSDVTARSSRLVWWLCDKGHSWEAKVSNRVKGTGCPYCKGRKVLSGYNDLATTNPELLDEWADPDILPTEVSAGSDRKVLWRCPSGHEWLARINNRVRGSRCPYCTGKKVVKGETDLVSHYPELVKEWNFSKNKIELDEVSIHSNLIVWWSCAQGHEWQARVYCRTEKGTGCPYCAGRLPIKGQTDLATLRPEMVAEWHPYKNNKLTPADVTPNSNRKVWWRCVNGHEWPAYVYARARGQGCPYCNRAKKKGKANRT